MSPGICRPRGGRNSGLLGCGVGSEVAPDSSSSLDKNDYTFAGHGSLGYQFAAGHFVIATYEHRPGRLRDGCQLQVLVSNSMPNYSRLCLPGHSGEAFFAQDFRRARGAAGGDAKFQKISCYWSSKRHPAGRLDAVWLCIRALFNL